MTPADLLTADQRLALVIIGAFGMVAIVAISWAVFRFVKAHRRYRRFYRMHHHTRPDFPMRKRKEPRHGQ